MWVVYLNVQGYLDLRGKRKHLREEAFRDATRENCLAWIREHATDGGEYEVVEVVRKSEV